MDENGVPADASTLIYLAKADEFGTARACVPRIWVAPSVWLEAVEAGERIHAPEVIRIRMAERDGFLEKKPLNPATEKLARHIAHDNRLGRESEVLAIAAPRGVAIVDEGRAARVGETLGIRVISTLLLPALGLRGGGLNRVQAMGMLRRLAIVTGARADAVMAVETFLRGDRA